MNAVTPTVLPCSGALSPLCFAEYDCNVDDDTLVYTYLYCAQPVTYSARVPHTHCVTPRTHADSITLPPVCHDCFTTSGSCDRMQNPLPLCTRATAWQGLLVGVAGRVCVGTKQELPGHLGTASGVRRPVCSYNTLPDWGPFRGGVDRLWG